MDNFDQNPGGRNSRYGFRLLTNSSVLQTKRFSTLQVTRNWKLQYRVHPPDASIDLVDAVQTRLDVSFNNFKRIYTKKKKKTERSRFLMDADAVQRGLLQRFPGRVQRPWWTRPATLVDASSEDNGRVHAEGQARPSVNSSASTKVTGRVHRFGKAINTAMQECVEKTPISGVCLFHYSSRNVFLNSTTLPSHEIFTQLNELYTTTIEPGLRIYLPIFRALQFTRNHFPLGSKNRCNPS